MKSEEIAKIAGVSRSTVSRVINDYPNVPQETREKVMKVIREYNYEPNTSARVLAGKRTNTLGLFLFSIYDPKSPFRIYGNNYFAPFVDAFVDIGNFKGFYILVHTIYSPKDCLRISQTFSQKRIDGGIIVGTERNREIDAIISQLNYPIALVDYDPKEINKIMCPDARITVINSDDEKGINKSVDYLVSLGHSSIGLIEGRSSTFSGLKRREYFIKRMEHHNLPIAERHMLKGDFTGRTSAGLVEELLKDGGLPTALVSCNDEMAIAAMDTLKRHGIRVPEDVSIIGYDDSPASTLVRPSLTSIRIPFYDMARKAVESLSDMIETDRGGLEVSKMDVELMIRESCAER